METCCAVWWGKEGEGGKAEPQQQEDVVQSVPLDRGQRGGREGTGLAGLKPVGGGDLFTMGHTLKCLSDGRWECLDLPSLSPGHSVSLCWCHPGFHHQRNETQRLGQACPPGSCGIGPDPGFWGDGSVPCGVSFISSILPW